MLKNSLSAIACTSDFVTRSISPENLSGEPGQGARIAWQNGTAHDAARDLGDGWKVNPYLLLDPDSITTIAEIDGSGSLQHIWMTPGTREWRHLILRIYWDNSDVPAVECPVGDFFASGWCQYAPISSLAVCVNPGSAFNCYWTMPFRKHCKITIENLIGTTIPLFYQVTYELGDVPENAAYFHAQFRRVNPLPYKDVFTILDNIEGLGQYVGTYMAWGSNNNGWWGEGEIKFYMDGDKDYPTICGTGTEDYFCGSYGFDNPHTGKYQEYTTPYCGMSHVIRPDGHYKSQTRFSLYRWHVTDPIRFKENLKVTMQALGWRSGMRYLPLQDDIAAVAYFYLNKPATNLPPLPDKDGLEII